LQFVSLDLGDEESCRELTLFMREMRPVAVIHLAFVKDAVRAGVDPDRMWQINVAGTARVMEAVTEANRDEYIVEKFIYPSSVEIYGSDLSQPASENSPLSTGSSLYAIHKIEADKVIQQRSPSLRGCSVFMLRPHMFAGAGIENSILDTFRGVPNGPSKRAQRMRDQGNRLPCLLPYGSKYLDNRFQFVHVEDVARLIIYILARTEPEAQRLTVLNLAGRGEPLTFAQCVELTRAKLMRVPGEWIFRLVHRCMGLMRISAIPPEASTYMISEYLMNTGRLQKFLGRDYEDVIRYSIEEAFTDSFSSTPALNQQHSSVSSYLKS
jgi:nucleoside-diphosphate-sugar epimerase